MAPNVSRRRFIGGVGAAAAGTAVAGAVSRGQEARAETPPNIIFILVDDMSTNLIEHTPALLRMQSDGATLKNFILSDPICGPSRASIFTGQFPHNNGVFRNEDGEGLTGGLSALKEVEDQAFPVHLQAGGYRTAYMGKYINGYEPKAQPRHVPVGWDEFHGVGNNGYHQVNYDVGRTMDGVSDLQRFNGDEWYLTKLLGLKAESAIQRSVNAGQPLFLMVAPTAPHASNNWEHEFGFLPEEKYKDAYPGLKAPRTPRFNGATDGKTDWLAQRAPLDTDTIDQIDNHFRRRAQMMLSVSDMIDTIRNKVDELGLTNNTYIIFASDHGLQHGDFKLRNEKATAYQMDARVPLIAIGPDIPPGITRTELVQNIDLFGTFINLGIGAHTHPHDGRNLLGLLRNQQVNWPRKVAFIEDHTSWPFQKPWYKAIRTSSDELYIEYQKEGGGVDIEYYDLRNDHNPWQIDNDYDPSDPRMARLHEILVAHEDCYGNQCRIASTMT